MALAHGPYNYPWIRNPSLPTDVAGETWDGGPLASIPLIGYQHTVPLLDCDLGKEDGARFDQVPLLEFSDEGALATSSPRTEVFDQKVLNVVNPWNTYGPIAGPSRLIEYVQRYREYLPPTVGVPQTGWAAPGVREGTNATLFSQEITFKEDLQIKSLGLGHFFARPEARLAVHAGGKLHVFDLSQPGKDESFRLQPGDWLGLFGLGPATCNLFINRGEPIWLTKRGSLVELAPDPGHAVELILPRPGRKLSFTVPVRIAGLNPRWSAGLWQRQGYVKGDYGPGENRYRALGLDLSGHAYLPLYPDHAALTHVVAGHPVIAGPEGKELFLQVTKVGQNPDRFHVSINNPTDRAITTTLTRSIPLPGLDLPQTKLTLKPGEYLVVR